MRESPMNCSLFTLSAEAVETNFRKDPENQGGICYYIEVSPAGLCYENNHRRLNWEIITQHRAQASFLTSYCEDGVSELWAYVAEEWISDLEWNKR